MINEYVGMLTSFLIQTFKRAEFICHSYVNILQAFNLEIRAPCDNSVQL